MSLHDIQQLTSRGRFGVLYLIREFSYYIMSPIPSYSHLQKSQTMSCFFARIFWHTFEKYFINWLPFGITFQTLILSPRSNPIMTATSKCLSAHHNISHTFWTASDLGYVYLISLFIDILVFYRAQ